MKAIWGFDHRHKLGDVCSPSTCEFANRKPALHGVTVRHHFTLRIGKRATIQEYLHQKVPEGWVIPKPGKNDHFYEAEEVTA